MNIDEINIPAYQRKNSLLRKASKITAQKKVATKPKRGVTRLRLDEPDLTDIAIRSKVILPEPVPTETKPKTFQEMQECGHCEGYFEKINVAIVKVTSPIRVGDTIIFEKEGGLFQQTIESMQIDRKDVSLARSGSDIGLKTAMKPKVGTPVYKYI